MGFETGAAALAADKATAGKKTKGVVSRAHRATRLQAATFHQGDRVRDKCTGSEGTVLDSHFHHLKVPSGTEPGALLDVTQLKLPIPATVEVVHVHTPAGVIVTRGPAELELVEATAPAAAPGP